MKTVHIVGARPNFMKAAPVMRALESAPGQQRLVHTGQHYDANMSKVFFGELDLPRPDMNLEVGSASHAVQTAEVMKRLEPVLLDEAPDVVLVYGDINSTVAAALVATKLRIAVAHVEAGLRSFDRNMPEEINRVLTDQMADLLFTHSPEAEANLAREGIDADKVHCVGNVMIDTLVRLLPRARARNVAGTWSLPTGEDGKTYVLATLHRPSNVDDPHRLRALLQALEDIARCWPVVLPLHPRTRQKISDHGLALPGNGVIVMDPVGYLDFLALQCRARAVITDSGGIQEETTYLGVPCFTVRSNTERPVTISHGTNRLVGENIAGLRQAVQDSLSGPKKNAEPPDGWDGHAAERIRDILLKTYGA